MLNILLSIKWPTSMKIEQQRCRVRKIPVPEDYEYCGTTKSFQDRKVSWYLNDGHVQNGRWYIRFLRGYPALSRRLGLPPAWISVRALLTRWISRTLYLRSRGPEPNLTMGRLHPTLCCKCRITRSIQLLHQCKSPSWIWGSRYVFGIAVPPLAY